MRARQCQNPFSSVSTKKNTPSCRLKDPIRCSESWLLTVSRSWPPGPDRSSQFAVPVTVPSSVTSSTSLFFVVFCPREFKVLLFEVQVPLRTDGFEKLISGGFVVQAVSRQTIIPRGIRMYLLFLWLITYWRTVLVGREYAPCPTIVYIN